MAPGRLADPSRLASPSRRNGDCTASARPSRRNGPPRSSGPPRWIGPREAKRLLALGSENAVKAWARCGLLRSRKLPNGRTQVLLDDVLRRREETEGLSAVDGAEAISTQEALALLRPRSGEDRRRTAGADSTR